ncbi:uncharacterized protein VTP21DRAFT_3578 [Calcarisporiella thermophila]|uniref:uncharacterized protein n=1 Tax=Calcarisporiella thermophila TaxID=911321 RepID=UPI003742127E
MKKKGEKNTGECFRWPGNRHQALGSSRMRAAEGLERLPRGAPLPPPRSWPGGRAGVEQGESRISRSAGGQVPFARQIGARRREEDSQRLQAKAGEVICAQTLFQTGRSLNRSDFLLNARATGSLSPQSLNLTAISPSSSPCALFPFDEEKEMMIQHSDFSSRSNTPESSHSSAIPTDNDERIRQLLLEKANLRSQAEQLWKIVEKQRTLLQALQKDLDGLTAERQGFIKRIAELEQLHQEKSAAQVPAQLDEQAPRTHENPSGKRSEEDGEKDEKTASPLLEKRIVNPQELELMMEGHEQDWLSKQPVTNLRSSPPQAGKSAETGGVEAQPLCPPVPRRSPFRLTVGSRDLSNLGLSDNQQDDIQYPYMAAHSLLKNASSLRAPPGRPEEPHPIPAELPSITGMAPTRLEGPAHSPTSMAPAGRVPTDTPLTPPISAAAAAAAAKSNSPDRKRPVRDRRPPPVPGALPNEISQYITAQLPSPPSYHLRSTSLEREKEAEPSTHTLPHPPNRPVSVKTPSDGPPPSPARQTNHPAPSTSPLDEPVSPSRRPPEFVIVSDTKPYVTETYTTASESMSGASVRVVTTKILPSEKGRETLSFTLAIVKEKMPLKPSAGELSWEELRIHGEDTTEELWRVEKLYSDFVALDSKLRKREGKATMAKVGKLPDARLNNTIAPTKVDQRKRLFEQYLIQLITMPLANPSIICEFLSTNLIDKPTQSPETGYKDGYLTKRGRNFGGWKKRFFVLNNSPVLNYFENRDGEWLGRILLTHSKIGRHITPVESASADSYRHAIIILEPKKPNSPELVRHILCASSDEERDEWVRALARWIGTEVEGESDVAHMPGGGVASEERGGTSMKRSASTKSLGKIARPSVEEPQGAAYMPHRSHQHGQPTMARRMNDLEERKEGTAEEMNLATPIRRRKSSVSREPNSAPHSPLYSSSLPTNMPGPAGLFGGRSGVDHSGPPPDHWPSSPASITSFESTNRSIAVEHRAPLPSPRAIPGRGGAIGGGPVNSEEEGSSRNAGGEEEVRTTRVGFGFGRVFKPDAKPAVSPTAPNLPPEEEVRYVSGSRRVFGVPLMDAIRVAPLPQDSADSSLLPAVVYRCIQYLEAHEAEKEEGIYRLSGSSATIRMLKDRFNSEGDVDLLSSDQYYDVHAVAGLLKLYFRELPTSILTRRMHMDFLRVIDLEAREHVPQLRTLIAALPPANCALLRALMRHLIKVVRNSNVNRMTTRNVGIVFSPTLGIPAGVFTLLIKEYDGVFGDAAKRDGSPTRASPTLSSDRPPEGLEDTSVWETVEIYSDRSSRSQSRSRSRSRRREERESSRGQGKKSTPHPIPLPERPPLLPPLDGDLLEGFNALGAKEPYTTLLPLEGVEGTRSGFRSKELDTGAEGRKRKDSLSSGFEPTVALPVAPVGVLSS